MSKKKPHIGDGDGGYIEGVRARHKARQERVQSGKVSPKDGNE